MGNWKNLLTQFAGCMVLLQIEFGSNDVISRKGHVQVRENGIVFRYFRPVLSHLRPYIEWMVTSESCAIYSTILFSNNDVIYIVSKQLLYS